MMKTAEIRERFLAFFEGHQHERVASSSLVPHNDPTLLFTNAGMVQFKDVFLGTEKRESNRATTSQRCVRAGGKHNDLENVGYTARHHTFFEMLGNFSFGEYFKRDAIHYAWQFLTDELKLPKERLWVTVFEEDDEAADIWLKEIGIGEHQFSRIGAKDNFWSMGDTGPCGPCSEIFYDHGEDVAGGPPGTPEEDGDRFIEIWNLVFMQYDRSADGTMTPLPKPSVDTGMGLERIAAVMQDVHNNYDIDLFQGITSSICKILGTKDQSHHSVRVLADHIRSAAFLIVDGVLPSNEGRGYVLRRIVRRAIRHGYQLGGKSPFFHKIVDSLTKEMGDAYPELREQQGAIESALEREEQRFAETLDQGMKIFEQKVGSLVRGSEVPGEVVFLLYDTYGFPADLTADVARERGLILDMAGFEKAMDAQRARARSHSQFAANETLNIANASPTSFIGYDQTKATSTVSHLVEMRDSENNHVDKVRSGDMVAIVVNETPFYAEGGGQVGDIGQISCGNCLIDVHDTKKLKGDVFAHLGVVKNGELSVNDEVQLEVSNSERRSTAKNHSATHLLHAALAKILGSHIQQKGSLVDSEKLRFDFSHDKPVTADEIRQIEYLVNSEVMLNREVTVEVMPIDKAKAAGAAALFGEKYGDNVRVVGMGDFSLELCGGTHVVRTGDIGFFKITAEASVAAGVRRLEAVTGGTALKYVSDQLDILNSLSNRFKVSPEILSDRIEHLHSQMKALQKENKDLQKTLATGGAGKNDLESKIKDIGDVKLLVADMQSVDKSILRDTIDGFKSKYDNAIILLATRAEDKVPLVAGVSKNIASNYPAGKLIQYVTGKFGGRGGGRPDMAEGGIADVGDIADCLNEVEVWVREQSS